MTDLAAHVSRYLSRVDAHLPTIASDEDRRAFLKHEENKWIERYSAFSSNVIAGGKVDPDVNAADYILTIAELRIRADQIPTERKAA